MRRVIAVPCRGETLAGTLDEADGATGLLIVSGGNEVRAGAHRGMAVLAQRLAATGIPVFRFDRRGIGDSTGENGGYLTSAPDIAAAAASFRREQPQITRLYGFGNCDAASALALFHAEAGLDGLILANPWTGAEGDDLPAAAAIRARYAERLRDPRAWLRALRGGVDFGRLVSGLRKLSAKQPEQDASLAQAFAGAPIAALILAERDNTARAFAAAFAAPAYAEPRARITPVMIDSASHSFARAGDAEALERTIRGVIQSHRPRSS